MKFQLLDLDWYLFSKMRNLFKSLVDVDVSYPKKDTKDGFLMSIPSNYGYVFFWFGWLDQEALNKYYKEYLSEDELRKVEEAKTKSLKEYGLFQLSDHIRDYLFPIVYDHSDTIGNGFAEVYLAIVSEDDLKEVSIDKAISILKDQAERLEKLKNFEQKVREEEIKGIDDMEIHYETIKFVDEEASDEEIGALIENDELFNDENYKHIFHRDGWEIKLSIDFDGDDTLKEVVERIDKAISPLKRIVNRMVRYESSYDPF